MEDEEKAYRRARARIREIKIFFSSLVTYLAVNVVLFLINYLTSPDRYWFYWVALIWGVFIVVKAFKVFVFGGLFGRKWEQRQIDKYMEKDQGNFNQNNTID